MAHVKLLNGGTALVDDEDYDRVIAYGNWRKIKRRNTWYVVSGRRCKTKLHILILGKKPGLVIDHQNENGLDCRKKNLSHITNGDNIRKSSRRQGYRQWGKKWQVRMMVNGRKILETYSLEAEAQNRVKELKLWRS